MAYADRRARLRLVLPKDWIVVTDGILDPFTSSAYPPRDDEDEDERARLRTGQAEELGLWAMLVGDEPMPLFDNFSGAHDPLRSTPKPTYRSARHRARERAEEWALWTEAMGEEPRREEPHFDEDPEELDEPREDDDPVVFAGTWSEDFSVDAPDEEDLLAGAAWLASSCGEFLWFFRRHEPLRRSHGLDYSQRPLTIGGRPAAAVAYRYLGGRDGETTAELRLVAIHLSDDRVSFALGLAHSADHCRLIDDVLDSVKPLRRWPR
ncbi:hypothetical protein [Streptomyces sp. 6N223]|uniref:hypothetical protein n=1 Tax=Streptomyces sp. 6N223 TaxID=3457412 RepID=UPI003FCFF5D2